MAIGESTFTITVNAQFKSSNFLTGTRRIMMKRKFLQTITLTLAMSLLSACGTNQIPEDEQPSAEIETPQDDTVETPDSEDDSDLQSQEGDFFTMELTTDKVEKADIDKDGQDDELSLVLNEKDTSSYGYDVYDVKINDQTSSLFTEDDFITFMTMDVTYYFAHKADSNYVFVSIEGDAGKRSTSVFKVEDSSLEKVQEFSGELVHEITDGYLYLKKEVECFETLEVADAYYFTGDESSDFEPEAGMNKAQTIIDAKPFTLKADTKLSMDESGEEPKQLKAGDKIYPSYYDENGWIGFEDKDGNSVGCLDVNSEDAKDLFE